MEKSTTRDFHENRVLGMDRRRIYCRVQWHMLTDLRCWGRTRVVMLANFHYNSIMTLSVYISAKRTIIGYIKPPRQDINS